MCIDDSAVPTSLGRGQTSHAADTPASHSHSSGKRMVQRVALVQHQGIRPSKQCSRVFFRFLDCRRPRSWWLEEVIAFSYARDDLGGKSALQLFAVESSRRGYAVRAKILCHGLWVRIPRTRIFVWGIEDECGGARGADWVARFLAEVVRVREADAPTPLSHLFRHDDWEEQQ